jgi:hypothetical protein
MTIRPSTASLGLAALIGVILFFALIVFYAALSGVIEPYGRIEAFLLAPPRYRHPIQLAVAGWSLYLFTGALVGVIVRRVADGQSRSPWALLVAGAAGYLVALLGMLPSHGMPPIGAIGHAAALFAAAAAVACAPGARVVR